MCGIFGYVGPDSAERVIVRGLQRLEYRGYDSAGVVTVDTAGHPRLVRQVGRVQDLKNKVEHENPTDARIGIGHTRWATHGGVTEENCHPHYSQDRRYYGVHNGIVENYQELRGRLAKDGAKFYGQTDSEVTVNFFASIATEDPLESLKKLVSKIEGAYALLFLDTRNPNALFGAKKGSPLVLGFSRDAVYCSSDQRSLEGICDEYVALEDGDIFLVRSPNDYTILNNGVEIVRDRETLSQEDRVLELGDYPHFMLKEIHEQADVIRNVLAGRVDLAACAITNPTLEELAKRDIKAITVVASGTSYHAGLVGKYYFEHLADIETQVVVSAEFKYAKHFIRPDTLYVFVSQSGETADTLECLKIVKAKGGKTFGIVNVPGSSIARLSDAGLYTHAGVEVGVASSKAFTGQIATLLLVALALGNARDLDYVDFSNCLYEFSRLPEKIVATLERSDSVKTIAKKYSKYRNFFFLGRGLELPIAQEGSLKLKELTYRHAEAYSSGELKHGSLALVDGDFPTIILNADGPMHSKNLNSVQEVKARSGKVIGIVSDAAPAGNYDDILRFPQISHEFVPFLEVVILQLFAYHMTVELGNDVDKPRNLAKSVTVE